jgi:hypothetical protein
MTWHLGWSWGMLGLGLGDKFDLWSSFIMVRETLSSTGFARCAQWGLNVSASTQRYFNLFHRLTWSLVRSIADPLLCICKTLHHRLLWLMSGLTGDTESEPRPRNVIGCWVVGPSWFLSKKFQARSEWTYVEYPYLFIHRHIESICAQECWNWWPKQCWPIHRRGFVRKAVILSTRVNHQPSHSKSIVNSANILYCNHRPDAFFF